MAAYESAVLSRYCSMYNTSIRGKMLNEMLDECACSYQHFVR